MESPNLVRVVAAFVAGVVIALGSALIYVRVSEMVHPQPVALEQAPVDLSLTAAAAVPSTTEPIAPPEPEVSEPARAPAAVPQAKKPGRWMMRRQAATAPARKPQPKIALARLAQSGVPVTRPVTYTTPNSAATSVPQVEAPEDNPAPLSAASDETTPQVAAPAPGPQPHTITLQAGTALPIRLSETLSTDHNYTGDTFRGTLDAAIITDGFIIADRGSKVLGRVVAAERPGGMQGTSNLNLTLTEINTTDGQRIRVQTTSFEQTAPTSMGRDAATIAGGAALGAIIGAAAAGGKGAAIGAGLGGAAGTGAVFATRSKPATLPVETTLTFRLATPLTITEKLN